MSGEIVQATFDYSLVTGEQASQLQEIYNRVLTRHVATAYEDGKDLLEARGIKNLSYKHFISWAFISYGWGESSVKDKINIALRWGPITPTVGVIEDRAMYLLSTKFTPETARKEAKELLSFGEDIDEERAKEIRDAHKAREEAEKRTKETQQQLNFFTKLSDEKIDDLSQQIDELAEKLRTATTHAIKEVVPPYVLDKVANLEALVSKQKERIDLLEAHSEKLAAELQAQLDANEARRKREQYEAGIRNEWKKTTDALCKAMTAFIGQIPAPMDIEVFEAREWAKYDQTEQALRNCQEAFTRVKNARYGDFFVDSHPYHQEMTVYEQAQTIDAL